LLGGWCAAVLLTVCSCTVPAANPTNAGDAHTGQQHHPNHRSNRPGVAARPLAQYSSAIGGLSLITEPGTGNQPFITLIDSAKHNIEVTMYELTDERVEHALAATAARGVRVAVLLDDGQYGAGRPLNDAAYRYLAAHGVSVAWTPGYFALTHQKSIVVDGRVAAIMTLNLTSAYYSSSRDFAVLDDQPADVAAITQTFEADLRHQQLTPSTDSSDLVWSPGAQAPIGTLIVHAQRSVEVESEEMDDLALTRELCQAAQQEVRVQVVMTYQPAWRVALTYLADCGVQVRTYIESAALYIHAKLIRVDGRTVFIGSQNLSRQSLTYNRELGIITQSPPIVARTGATFSADFAAAQPYFP
jgi:cardiolipin synthase A/B